MSRDGIHFSVFRPGMVLREMSQLKKHGRFVFIDPWAVHEAGFHTTVNVNDVVVVTVDSDGLPLEHVLTCLDDRGQIRKGRSRYPLEWRDSGLKDVIQECLLDLSDACYRAIIGSGDGSE